MIWCSDEGTITLGIATHNYDDGRIATILADGKVINQAPDWAVIIAETKQRHKEVFG